MEKDDKTSRLERQIDENLRRVYAQAVEQDMPERFEHLLRKLREQDRSK